MTRIFRQRMAHDGLRIEATRRGFRRWSLPWLATWLLAFGGTAGADTIVLRTGEVFTGKILRISSDEVSIQLESGGLLSFRAHRIEKVRRQGSSEEIVFGKDGPIESKEAAQPELPPPPAVTGPAGAGPAAHDAGDEDLAAFPLHARKAPAAATPAGTAGTAAGPEHSRYRDPARRFSVLPPPAFKPWNEPKLPPGLKGFMDPRTQANLTISTYESEEPVDRIKEGIALLLPRHSSAKVVGEARRSVPGPEGYEGWVLSLENSVGDATVQQLQFLAKSGRRVFILTYSAASQSYPGLARAFQESVESFRVEQAPAPAGASAREPPAEPEPMQLPPEVRARLKGGSSGRSAARPAPHFGPLPPVSSTRERASAIIDRVDYRVRGAPLGATR